MAMPASLLESKTCLSEVVKIYIPSTMDVNAKIDSASYVTRAMELFANKFNGATSQKVEGAWVSKKGLVTEDVTIVYSYASALSTMDINVIVKFAEWLKMDMKQECISLEVNGKLYFI